MLIPILLLKSQHTLHTYSGEQNPKILSYNSFLYNLSGCSILSKTASLTYPTYSRDAVLSLEPAIRVRSENLFQVNDSLYYPQHHLFSQGCSKVSRRASRPTLGTSFWAWSWLWGSGQKFYKEQITSFTILNNLYLAKDALKYSEGRPDLPWGHVFEPGAGCVVRP